MSVSNGVKSVGGGALGLLGCVAFFIAGFAILTGLATFSVWALEWTAPAFSWALIAAALLLIMAIIPALRAPAALGMMLVGIVFTAIVWIWGMSYTYLVWGMFGVIVGLVIFGVGVIPLAMVASVLHADWRTLLFLVGGVVMSLGTRALSRWLIYKVEERKMRQRYADVEATAHAHSIDYTRIED